MLDAVVMQTEWIDSQQGVRLIFSDRLACRSQSLEPKSIRSRGANYIRSTRSTPLTTMRPTARRFHCPKLSAECCEEGSCLAGASTHFRFWGSFLFLV